VQRIGAQAALFAFADAGAGAPIDGGIPVAPAPVFLSLGKRERVGFLRIEISKSATDLALRRVVGF
jgi:hypothetical protein